MQQRIGNPFAAKEKSEHASPDQALHRLIDALHQHREALRVWTSPYEYSQPYSLGGAQITAGIPYRVQSPFDSWCEYCVSQVTFVGTGPFSAVLSASAPGALPTNASAVQDQSGRDTLPFASNASATVPLPELWYPLPAGQPLYLVVGSGGGVQVSVQFRRRVNPAGIYSESNS